MSQELNSKLEPNINDTLMHCQEASTTCMAIDSQVCFHRRLFADPVKPRWCMHALQIMLGHWGALIRIAGVVCQVAANGRLDLSCGLCAFLSPIENTASTTVCHLMERGPAFGVPNHPRPSHHLPSSKRQRDITGAVKTLSSEYCMGEFNAAQENHSCCVHQCFKSVFSVATWSSFQIQSQIAS